MIVLDLCCEHGHTFEGWFASASAFQDQCSRGLVSCPVCGVTQIVRKPSAPYINTRSHAAPDSQQPAPPHHPTGAATETVAAVIQALRQVAKLSEDVGQRFPEEARRIHYGETEARSIKGKASPDQMNELLEEGIMVMPLPPDETDLH